MYKLLKDFKKGDFINVHLGDGITEEVKTSGRSRTPGEWYYSIHNDGNIEHEFDAEDVEDDWSFQTGNYFKTEQEAKEYKEVLEIEAELRELADWDGGARYVLSYYTTLSAEAASVHILSFARNEFLGNKYCFQSRATAKAAIEKIGEERLRRYLTYVW